MLDKIIKVTIYIFFFLFPLFYLPVTADSYEYNKMALLVLTTLILIFLFSLKVVAQRKLTVVKSSFGIPFFFLGILAIGSALFQSPNIAVSLITPLSTTTIVAGFLLYVLLVHLFHNLVKSDPQLDKISLMTILVFNSILLSLYIILLYTGFLPQNQFSPAGSLLSAAMFLSTVAVYLISYLINYALAGGSKKEISNLAPPAKPSSAFVATSAKEAATHGKSQNYEDRTAKPRVSILETDLSRYDNRLIETQANWPMNIQAEQKLRSEKLDTEALQDSEEFIPNKLHEPEKFDTESSSTNFILYIVSLFIIVLAIILLTFHLLTDQKPLILPFSFGWPIFLEVAKNIKTLLLGVGPANFLTAFTLTRPLDFNNTPLWNVVFTSSSSLFLNLATEIGAVAAVIYLFLLLKSLKLLTAVKQLTTAILPIILSLIFALILQIVLPGSMSIFILTIILLALVSEKKEVAKINLSAWGKIRYLLLLPVLILIIVIFYFGGRTYLAEVSFKRSLDALLNNQGKEAYDLQRQAITLNPYLDRYHLVFSQTNLALANALAAKEELSTDDKQNIPRLVQQAIDQARIAVVLYRTNAINWDNLGKTYSSLLTFASGAQDWAINSYQQKLLLDPLNPNNYLILGKLYLNLKKYTEAENHFKQAINFKPDFANAHYNLSIAFQEQKKYQEAYKELQATATLLQPDSQDSQKVARELVELAKLLPAKESTPASQPKTPNQPQTLEEAAPSPGDFINPLAPVSTIALPQPPITP